MINVKDCTAGDQFSDISPMSDNSGSKEETKTNHTSTNSGTSSEGNYFDSQCTSRSSGGRKKGDTDSYKHHLSNEDVEDDKESVNDLLITKVRLQIN